MLCKVHPIVLLANTTAYNEQCEEAYHRVLGGELQGIHATHDLVHVTAHGGGV